MSYTYRLTSDPTIVIRQPDMATIISGSTNPDWTEYQTWLSAGNIPDNAIPFVTLQTNKIAQLNSQCYEAIVAGFPVTIDGVATTVTLQQTDQNNNLTSAITVQNIMSTARPWAANTSVNLYDVCVVNNQYYVCEQMGTTGSVTPTMPNLFHDVVQDGTAVWAKFGLLVGTSSGNVWCDANTIYSIFKQSVLFINANRSKYSLLASQVAAATTSAELLSITW